jgi:hypothetical protein
MTDSQILTVALASVPAMIAVLIGILMNNGRISDLNGRFGDLPSRLTEMNSRMGETNSRISELRSHMDNRFNESRDIWRAELH